MAVVGDFNGWDRGAHPLVSRGASGIWEGFVPGVLPGALYKLLDPFARHRINMTRIESRPSRSGKWEYVFFIDIEGHVDDELVRQALADLDPLDGDVRVLGAYPVALL